MDSLEQKTVSMFRIAYLSCSTVFIFLIFSCKSDINSIPYYNSADFTPYFLSNKDSINKRITHKINDFSFINQDNNIFSNKDIEGKIHVANFIFTTCTDICPKMTSNMKDVGSAFFNDPKIRILSFSVTPWIDTPEKLSKYVDFHDIKTNNWAFKSFIFSLPR